MRFEHLISAWPKAGNPKRVLDGNRALGSGDHPSTMAAKLRIVLWQNYDVGSSPAAMGDILYFLDQRAVFWTEFKAVAVPVFF